LHSSRFLKRVENMKSVFVFLLLFSLSIGAETIMLIFEQRDFGPTYEEQFDEILVTMDCDADIITIYVTDEHQPAAGAVVRLLYVDYSVPLLGAGPTDSAGKFQYTLVGDKNLMNGLFLVVIEKEGYNNKEAHFDVRKCTYEREEEPPPQPEPAPEEEPEEEPPPVEEPEEPIEEPEAPEPEENITENVTENITGEHGEEEAAPLCPSFMILLLLLVLIKQ